MAVHWRLSGDYYVDGIGGDDANAGTSVAPFKSIGAAASAARRWCHVLQGIFRGAGPSYGNIKLSSI